MSSSVRNLIIAVLVILVIGGIAYTKLSVTEQDPSENIDDGTTSSVEPPSEPDEEETQPEESEAPTEPEDPETVEPESEEETTETPVGDWWKERQVPFFSNLATVMVTGSPYPSGEYTKQHYLDIIDQTGVTTASWFDYMWKPINNDEWVEYIDLMHSRGIEVVGCDSMITTWKMGPDPPEHEASICLDPYGNKVTSNYGLSGTIGDESEWYIHTTINPDWREYLLEGIKRNIDAGVDGYLVDELCYSAVLEPDFSEYTMNEFKLYLDDALTDTEKNTYKNQLGLTSWDDLDYAKEVRKALPSGWSQLTYDDWRDWNIQQDIPLSNHYQRFLRVKNRETAEYLIEEAKIYAESQGREMPFSINVNDLSSPEGLLITDLVDFLDLECDFNKFEGYYPRTRATAPVKLSLGLGLTPNVLTNMETRASIVEKGPDMTTTLYKLMIADVTASGGNMYMEEGAHSIRCDLDSLEPYYNMPENYPSLFDLKPYTSQVCVLHLWENLDGYQSKAFQGTCQLLSDTGFQYDVVFGAEDYLQWGEVTKYPAPNYPLILNQIKGYNLIIVPELMDITNTHAEVLLEYLNQGGTLLVFTSPTNLQTTQNQRSDDPNVNTLLGFLRQEDASVGSGRVITINQVKGTQYIDSPENPIRVDFMDMVVRTGITPEITGMTEGCVSKIMYSSDTEAVIHLVNCKYDGIQDTVKPVPDRTLQVRLPDSIPDEEISITYYTPEGAIESIGYILEDTLVTFTVPSLDVWGIIHINRD